MDSQIIWFDWWTLKRIASEQRTQQRQTVPTMHSLRHIRLYYGALCTLWPSIAQYCMRCQCQTRSKIGRWEGPDNYQMLLMLNRCMWCWAESQPTEQCLRWLLTQFKPILTDPVLIHSPFAHLFCMICIILLKKYQYRIQELMPT